MRGLLPLVVLALPLAEIAGFIVVGKAIGLLPTLCLVVAGVFVGVALLRHQGFGLINRLRSKAASGGDPGRELVHGALLAVAAVLLIIPGFISDIAGLVLFLPAVRDAIWKRMALSATATGGRAGFSWSTSRSTGRPDAHDPRVIDLDAGEFSHGAPRDLPPGDPKG
ncbi:FxsA family protein [Ensifer soli]|uniref:FxsA family protein n=1 Tax=Ciceribacter sp. sgz301302 TaxID=3342379 RepID=UPI0035BB4615